jgi:hypothetical protein
MIEFGRYGRICAALLIAALAILLAAQSALAAVTWTPATGVGPTYSTNFGLGLARTVTASSAFLHSQYTYDGGTRAGVYYRRGNAAGSSWSTAKRLNPATSNAERGAIAAAGHYVYVAWTTGYHGSPGYDPAAPRRSRVRVNTNHGSSTAWLPTLAMDAFLRSGRPAVAASGTYVYVVVTDADTGAIHLLTNNGVNSPDIGWLGTQVGTTTRKSAVTGDGFEGQPVVAALGSRVLVAWIASDTGGIVAKISTNRGHTWPDKATTLTTAQAWDPSAAADTGRFGVAWAQASGIKARLHTSGAWRSIRTVSIFRTTATYKAGYGTAIAFAGSARVGVAWSACTAGSCTGGASKGVDARWRESANNGGTWNGAVTIASHTYGSSRRVNDFPSVVMTDAPTRFVTYNTFNATWSSYRVVIEVGRGTP